MDTPLPATDLFDASFFQLASECTVEAWLSVLGHRWNGLILYHLSLGGRRFTELSKCMPTATPKVLTERVRELERRGLVRREGESRSAAYQLTPSGCALMPILHALEVWARSAPLSADPIGAALASAHRGADSRSASGGRSARAQPRKV